MGRGRLPPALPQIREPHSAPVGGLPGAAVAAVLAAAGGPFLGPGGVKHADGGLCYQHCQRAEDEKRYGGGAQWVAAAAAAAAAHGRRGMVSRAGPPDLEGQRWRAGWQQPLVWARAGWGWPLVLPWASWDQLAAAVVLQGKRKHAIFALDILVEPGGIMGPRRGLRGSWGSRESVATKAGAATGNGGAPNGDAALRMLKVWAEVHPPRGNGQIVIGKRQRAMSSTQTGRNWMASKRQAKQQWLYLQQLRYCPHRLYGFGAANDQQLQSPLGLK
ncbi:MAG: hypothetical protein FRX49_03034 [Trebouxia sp. A1-2]|nr:MAG: hypothetical protein FRX49_03034 [Trebouxia sp. A1-2]